MNSKIERLLDGSNINHIAPFFWQHGESEAVLRQYMGVIQQSGCEAVCVESRPHPDFCGPRWWGDMDIILDEARKRKMKVWILDDSHFPTGYANGALEDADPLLCRQSVFSNLVDLDMDQKKVRFDVSEYVRPPKLELSQLAALAAKMSPAPREFADDQLISITAVSANEKEIIDLTDTMSDGIIEWERPDASWQIYVNGLTRNSGAHRTYINMMNEKSCRVLIDTVYQAHYERYKEDFGKTLAGFFSDEPELGNGILYMQNNPIGTEQDLPWSLELENALTEKLGETWKSQLPLLWTKTGTQEAAAFRYRYMDSVTRLVQKDFSEQIGTWCREHGVAYIGHVIEDEGQHCRTASSLGHYFRGLSGQDMAGIDDIGGQVFPGGEDGPDEGPMGRTRNGEFYHYGLASLAASAAAIEPRKKGRAMCEIFGNYGWKEGVRLEKYLADHFLVRGINHFVPHAFSPKAYPDPDCPPHFYAHGHNPQYRHFGELIRYMNRLSDLFSGGVRKVTAAILYHGESEWCGECMPFEKVSRVLLDHQINSDVIPSDVFATPEIYRATIGKELKVNTQQYRVLIVPEAQFITKETIEGIRTLQQSGFPVVFINEVPKCCTGEIQLPKEACRVVPLQKLLTYMLDENLYEITIHPADNRIRVLHYQGETDAFMLVNEGESVYKGGVALPATGPCYRYDAMENQIEQVDYATGPTGTVIDIELHPLKGQVIVFDADVTRGLSEQLRMPPVKTRVDNWERSQCRSVEYPKFELHEKISLPDNLAEQQPEFSGLVRYETSMPIAKTEKTILEITEAFEGVEVFVNGRSAGIQIVAPFHYDISSFIVDGNNTLAIEVATTLERERAVGVTDIFEKAMMEPPVSSSGITGIVTLYQTIS